MILALPSAFVREIHGESQPNDSDLEDAGVSFGGANRPSLFVERPFAAAR